MPTQKMSMEVLSSCEDLPLCGLQARCLQSLQDERESGRNLQFFEFRFIDRVVVFFLVQSK